MLATTPLPNATILGYPRLGRRHELKRAVESFSEGRIDEAELRATARDLRAATRADLVALGLSAESGAVPESFGYFDQVLDATLALGAIPRRFADVVPRQGAGDPAASFALAHGDERRRPLETARWFDTNDRYRVPEIDEGTPFRVDASALVEQLEESRAQGVDSRPVIVGPVTYLLLAKASDEARAGFAPIDRLDDVVAVYAELLRELRAAGAGWVQIDEPALVADALSPPLEPLLALAERAYRVLGAGAAHADASTTGSDVERPSILLTTPYGDSSAALLRLAQLPVEAVHADLVHGTLPAGAFESGELASAFYRTQLVAGVVDGRDVWRTDLRVAFGVVQDLQVAGIDTVVATSSGLQHVPHDVNDETELDERRRSWLAFADQKVEQVALLSRGLYDGADAIEEELAEVDRVLADRAAAPDGGDARRPV